MTREQIIESHAAIPPGVLARHGSSVFWPVQVPDLIGLRERKYLDRTGLIRHRGIGDLMRYGALNQDADAFSNFGGFIPGKVLPPSPAGSGVPAMPARDRHPQPSVRASPRTTAHLIVP